MDRTWVRQRLEDFLALCRAYDQEQESSGYRFTAEASKLNSQINGDIPTIRETVKRLDPELVKEIDAPSVMSGSVTTCQAIERALGILRDEEELKARLAPDAPSVIAGRFQPRAGHAFLSYVREDSHEVDRLQRTLEAAGISVWRDTADLWPGEDWRAKIRRAIMDNALVFIACFSSRSVTRIKSYQAEDLTLAIEQLRMRRPDDPWLIPVRFDDCDIPDLYLGAGRMLASIQRVDLFDDRRDAEIERLVRQVLRILRLGRAVSISDQPVGPGLSIVTPGKPLPTISGSNSTTLTIDLTPGEYIVSWTKEGNGRFLVRDYTENQRNRGLVGSLAACLL